MVTTIKHFSMSYPISTYFPQGNQKTLFDLANLENSLLNYGDAFKADALLTSQNSLK